MTRENDPDGCDVIVWDGGNNDFPFFKPDLMVTVTDPHRPGHELAYYPGEVTLRIADVVVINKIDSAEAKDVETVRANIKRVNPAAAVILAESKIDVDDPSVIKDKRRAGGGGRPHADARRNEDRRRPSWRRVNSARRQSSTRGHT